LRCVALKGVVRKPRGNRIDIVNTTAPNAVDHDLNQSPSRTLPMGPPASASGEMWPMQAPVETPLKRASVSTATCLQNGRLLERGGDLVNLLHAGARGPPQMSTITSPCEICAGLMASMAALR
jgi:hypothetical protein